MQRPTAPRKWRTNRNQGMGRAVECSSWRLRLKKLTYFLLIVQAYDGCTIVLVLALFFLS